MTTSEEKKCCWECGHHGMGCIPSCYPEYCHNRNCSCHSTPVREEWEEEFDKKFPVIEPVSEDEADGTFVIKSDADKVKSFIQENRLSPLERLEEKVGNKIKGEEMKRYIAEAGSKKRNWHNGAISALTDVLSLIAHFKKEI